MVREEKLNEERVAVTVKADAAEVEAKPLDVKRFKTDGSLNDEQKAKILEENVIGESDKDNADPTGKDIV